MAPQNLPLTDIKLSHRETAIISLLTVLGALIRLSGFPRLGLVHFDEGTYALAGLWVLSRDGLLSLDPRIIAYAPGGFPVLVGLSYLAAGVSDWSAILVSVAAGTLTIPLAGWVGRRTFGPGAGGAAAAFACLSGFHVAFSRMALTDALFLCTWILALGIGQRFLELPGFVTGVHLGLGVGLSQLVKYHGWIAGFLVIVTAVWGALWDRVERTPSRLRSIWGFGLIAAVVAAGLYWPWYRFVEAHGGYSALLDHHRGYLGGLASWPRFWYAQLDQVAALSGGPLWNAGGWLLACLAGGMALAPLRGLDPIRGAVSVVGLLPLFALAPTSSWWIGIAWLFVRSPVASAAERLLGGAWVILSLLTPFYHPYARLWLPLLAIGWLLQAGLVARLLGWTGKRGEGALRLGADRLGLRIGVVILSAGIALAQGIHWSSAVSDREPLPSPLSRSDSLRNAVKLIERQLPVELKELHLLARPTVTYYLLGKAVLRLHPDLESLLGAASDSNWAIVDLTLLGPEPARESSLARLRSRWELVCDQTSELNLPTLLDVDPGAARGLEPRAAHAPLWLLRPKLR